jgi:hypothetical protein
MLRDDFPVILQETYYNNRPCKRNAAWSIIFNMILLGFLRNGGLCSCNDVDSF